MGSADHPLACINVHEGDEWLQKKPALNLPGSCDAFHISPRMYFKLRDEGKGPREMRLGRRVLITVESALQWARERERATEEVA